MKMNDKQIENLMDNILNTLNGTTLEKPIVFEIEIEDDEDDFYDDVDESNYNPYTGTDEYESEPFDLEW